MSSIGKEIRHRVEWLALLIATKTIPLLPRKCLLPLAKTLGALAAACDRRGWRIAESNLEAALGNEISARRRAEIIRESYQHFARTMLDLMWSPRLTPETFRQWFEITGVEEALADLGPGRSGIFVTIHYSNFEWIAQAAIYCGIPALLLAQEFKNPLLDPIFARMREHSGHEVAPREGGIIRMYKALKRGRHVALLTDLTLKPHEPSIAINCFGLPTCVTYAHTWLHQRTGAPIVPVYIEPLPDGRYRFDMQSKLEIANGATDVEIAQAVWDRFEPIVRRNPAPWLWMYKHWRYKLAGAAKPYPFYANVGPNFEARLIQRREALDREAREQA